MGNPIQLGLEVTADMEVTPGLLRRIMMLCEEFKGLHAVPIVELEELIAEFDGSK